MELKVVRLVAGDVIAEVDDRARPRDLGQHERSAGRQLAEVVVPALRIGRRDPPHFEITQPRQRFEHLGVGRPNRKEAGGRGGEKDEQGKRGREPLAGTALRVLRTKGSRPLFPGDRQWQRFHGFRLLVFFGLVFPQIYRIGAAPARWARKAG